jgi:hypothetical protein
LASTPEGKVKDKAKALYKKHGAKYDRATATGMGRNGRPDDLITRAPDGHAGAAEMKRDNVWEVSALQRIWLTQHAEAGGSSMVVNLTNLAMLEQWLQRPYTRLVAVFENNRCTHHLAYVPGYAPVVVKNPDP